MRVLQALLGGLPSDFGDYDDVGLILEVADDSVPPTATKTWQGAALVDAIQCGSDPAVLDILLRVSDPDVRDWIGRTPLIIAAANGSVRLVERLLKTKARVGAKDDDGQIAMHHACDQGHTSVVEILIKNKKMDLRAQDKWSRTPVTAAIRAGHQHIVKLLLPQITSEALKLEFVHTALYGQHHILEQILNFAMELDF